MQSGSIIYDLAVGQGGNSAFSKEDKINVVNGVKIMGIQSVNENEQGTLKGLEPIIISDLILFCHEA